ncbi:MAG: DUF1653 domain-containing protein [Lachnospiraceae bacterium]
MQEARVPVPGEFYRHFKNKLYQIKAIAYHSETKEKMVVYQAMYGTFDVYVRPYDMFMSEVDHIKYPEVTQKYRFEKVELTATVDSSATPEYNQTISESGDKIDPILEMFLDADTYQDKLNVVTGFSDKLDDSLITTMAMAMDVEVPQGPADVRLESLKSCIKAHIRYESERLR